MDELQKSWKQKLSESERLWEERDREERRRQEKRKTTPHFWNLNEDPLLTNSIIHLLLPGVCTVMHILCVVCSTHNTYVVCTYMHSV